MLFVWAFRFVYIIVHRTLYKPAGCILNAWNVLPATMCPVNRTCQNVLVVNACIDEKCMVPETEFTKFGLGNDTQRLSVRHRSIGKNKSVAPDVSSIPRIIRQND